ncbi:tetratricopeptide repeat protein [Streptomyces sp. PKU-EA00015]|nr:tetratricopeptide repeat protein [Streptomyces sp. PKU-EA00015]
MAHQQAANHFTKLGDRDGEGQALNNLGAALQQMRRFEEAIEAHQFAAERFSELGDLHREGQALNNLGAALQQMRRFDEAIEAHQQAADRFTELGDIHGEGQALNNLGAALQQVRRFAEATDAHQQAASRFSELGEGRSRVLKRQESRGMWRVLTGRGRKDRPRRPAADAPKPAELAPTPYVPALPPAAKVPSACETVAD